MNQLFLQKVWLDDVEQTGYPYDLPAVQALKQGLPLGSPVVFLVGENGVGKSTILEAMAAALGLNPEGGSRNARFATEETHTQLYQRLHLARGAVRPKDSYFVRGETLYNLATYLDGMENPWCEVPLHHHSHGEMMMELLYRRLEGGLYLMDEPEGALSPTRQMELLCRIRQMAKEGSQFIISTHSPILITCPGAEIWQVDEEGLHLTTYDKTDHFVVTREFLNHPEKMWKLLWGEEEHDL